MDDVKTTYTFIAETKNYPSDGRDYPSDSSVTISFDATEAHIDLVVGQFETFLRAAGYLFTHIDVAR
jgi:hypothetical protein